MTVTSPAEIRGTTDENEEEEVEDDDGDDEKVVINRGRKIVGRRKRNRFGTRSTGRAHLTRSVKRTKRASFNQ